MLKEFTWPYGEGEVTFKVDEKNIKNFINGKSYPAIEDVEAAVLQALENPIDSAPLRHIVRAGDKVMVLVSDITRGWINTYKFLPTMIRVMNEAGVPDEDITIMITLGAHRSNTDAELEEMIGADILSRIKVVQHDARDKDNMVYMGRTKVGTEVYLNKDVMESDKIIMTGGIVYHLMCGFGGGRKSIIPGFAFYDTIQENHRLTLMPVVGDGLNPEACSGATDCNPMHRDSMEIGSFARPHFIFNIVPAPGGGYAGVFAGNWVSAWQKGCELVEEIYGVQIDEPTDIVIACAGGYPKDINLYQSAKPMDNTYYAVKKGGAVIVVSECRDIKEPPDLVEWFEYKDDLELEKALRARFTVPGYIALRIADCRSKALYIIVTLPENADFVRQLNMVPATTVDEALEIAYKHCGEDASVTLMPMAANTLPIVKK